MSLNQKLYSTPFATSAAAPPSLLQQVAGAGGAAVITVSFIHPIDVVKTRLQVSGTGGARDYRSLGIGGTVKVRRAKRARGAKRRALRQLLTRRLAPRLVSLARPSPPKRESPPSGRASTPPGSVNPPTPPSASASTSPARS